MLLFMFAGWKFNIQLRTPCGIKLESFIYRNSTTNVLYVTPKHPVFKRIKDTVFIYGPCIWIKILSIIRLEIMIIVKDIDLYNHKLID